MSWQRHFAQFRSFDLETEQKLALCGQVFQVMAPHLQNSKIVPKYDDDEIELRARVDGVPVRVNLTDMGWVTIEMKIDNRAGQLMLERDHDKIPKHKQADDDWADDDELRVFIARGIFVEGYENDINQAFATLGALPNGFVPWLCGQLERLVLSRLFATHDTMSVGFEPDVDQMRDPVQHIMDAVHTLKQAATGLAQGTAGPMAVQQGYVQQAAPMHRVGCDYCGTLYVLGTSSHCPNCGAPYRG